MHGTEERNSSYTLRRRPVLQSQDGNPGNTSQSTPQVPHSLSSRALRPRNMLLQSEASCHVFKSVSSTPLCRPHSLQTDSGRGRGGGGGGKGVADVSDSVTASARLNMQRLRLELETRLERPSLGVVDVGDSINVSPGLAHLRQTPRGGVQEKQWRLTEKHNAVRRNADQLHLGGGVSLWPNMHSMRLSRRETIQLVVTSIVLVAAVIFFFFQVHKQSLQDLVVSMQRLETFSTSQTLRIQHGTDSFNASLLAWHRNFKLLMNEMSLAFGSTMPSGTHWVFAAGYVGSMGLLVYYLADNMYAPSRLTPRRIKQWVSLLVIVGAWTVLLLYWLALACTLESLVEKTVLQLSNLLGDLVESDLDLTLYGWVLQYWRTRCLPPTTQGVVTVGGLVGVRDVVFYLQYYCVPIATVLLSPVVRLVIALHNIYSTTQS